MRTKLHPQDLQLNLGLVQTVSEGLGWAPSGMLVWGADGAGSAPAPPRLIQGCSARGNVPPQLWELLFVSLHPIYFLQPRLFLLLSRLYVWLNRSFSSPRKKNAVGMKNPFIHSCFALAALDSTQEIPVGGSASLSTFCPPPKGKQQLLFPGF